MTGTAVDGSRCAKHYLTLWWKDHTNGAQARPATAAVGLEARQKGHSHQLSRADGVASAGYAVTDSDWIRNSSDAVEMAATVVTKKERREAPTSVAVESAQSALDRVIADLSSGDANVSNHHCVSPARSQRRWQRRRLPPAVR